VTTPYDDVIIVSGAGGGTLAHYLAPSGKKTLLLERGGWMTRVPENWNAEEVFVNNRYVSTDTRHDKNVLGAETATIIFADGGIMHSSPGL
jgi:choline dehydrogenase-like flavoprotein